MKERVRELSSFYEKHGRMPSYRELMELWNFGSTAAVSYAVDKLVHEGVIKKDKSGRLIPGERMGKIKVLGVVEAGWPSPAEEELVDTMSLDEYLIENKEATYMLRIKGDSMIEAGIQEGDLVLVERTNSPKVNSIVIAEVDGEWTIKFLRRRGGQLYLEPANSAYKPIFPKESLNVIAVVKAVVRKY